MLSFLLILTEESDIEKIQSLYETYKDLLWSFAAASLQRKAKADSTSDIEDIVQNTFVKIVRHIDKIDFSRREKDIRNYIFSILTNEISNHLNDIVYTDSYDTVLDNKIGYDIDDFIEELDIRNRYSKVVDAISQLDEKYSTTLNMAYCENMSVEEIANLMGISPKTVYTRLARGKELLRKALSERGIFHE